MADFSDVAEKVFTKLDALKDGLTEIKVQLARTEDHGKRIESLEGSVSQFQRDKAKVLGIVAVICASVPQLSSWLGGLVP